MYSCLYIYMNAYKYVCIYTHNTHTHIYIYTYDINTLTYLHLYLSRSLSLSLSDDLSISISCSLSLSLSLEFFQGLLSYQSQTAAKSPSAPGSAATPWTVREPPLEPRLATSERVREGSCEAHGVAYSWSQLLGLLKWHGTALKPWKPQSV